MPLLKGRKNEVNPDHNLLYIKWRLLFWNRHFFVGEASKFFSPFFLEISEIISIFVRGNNMNETMIQNVGLNQAQLDFLRLLAHFNTEEEVKELNDLVCQYYARKVDEEMDRLWDEGKWNQEKIEETLKEHLRTPYNA